ncbi:MAG: carbohydrate ABC transporter permease [Sphaerochaetaceae bacterium]
MVKNTFFVLIVAVPGAIMLSIFAAFALGRMKFGNNRLQHGVYTFFVSGVIMPTCVLILPIYLFMVKIGLYNTLWSTILTHIGWTAPMNMMIMVSGFKTIPDSLEEAAIIDGCNIWQLLFRILVPVAKPVISTSIILTFLSCWNDFPLARIMLIDPKVRTISLAAAYFKGTYSTNLALMTAGCVILIIPQLIIFTIFQRYIIDGVTAGAVKG